MAIHKLSSLSAEQHRFAVESGIPIAPRNSGKSKYPFLSMNVGDSFAFPGQEIERVRGAAAIANSKHKPMKFSVSATLLRCWRIA